VGYPENYFVEKNFEELLEVEPINWNRDIILHNINILINSSLRLIYGG